MTNSNYGQYAIDFYLEYFNQYLTVAKIAEHYEISVTTAAGLIKRGKELYNSGVAQ